MAGGKGTRIAEVAKDIPKPMIPVLGKPVLEYQIRSLTAGGVQDITLVIGHLGDAIRNYFGDGAAFGARIRYIAEEKPLGTAGALFYLKEELKEDFLLLFGDLMLDVDWERFMAFHKERGAKVTLFAHPNTHLADSDLIVTDADDRVLRIEPKNAERDFWYHNLTNAGIYCVSPEALRAIEAPEKVDLERGIIVPLISEGGVFAYHSTEYVRDMGTPDRLERVVSDTREGIVSGRSLRNPQRAVFLDRDGTLNELRGFLRHAEELELIPGAAEAVRELNRSPYLVIVVTNQPVLARGECSFEEMDRIHRKLETLLGKEGAYLDALYLCPHHPDKGFPGEVPELKIRCNCRKPQPGMLLQAAERYHISLEDSWMIGDSTADVQVGVNAGTRTILLGTGEGGADGKYAAEPTLRADDLGAAVQAILSPAL